MEALSPAPSGGTPALSPLPEAGHDERDPLNPEIEEEDSARTPPIGAPHQDMEVTEDKEELSDEESELSDIDDAQFEDFNPADIAIEERPVAVDENNVGLIVGHKRKRADDADGTTKKKKKEGRREKKSRKQTTDDDGFSGGEETGKRPRKRKEGGEKQKSRLRRASPENDENLTPEERRKRDLDRRLDAALKNPNRSRKRMDGIDLEAQNDELIETMRRRMTEAAKADTDARQRDQPAMQKLKMLPEVVALLNRNTLRDQLVDPDINLLEAVRFFLEPLNDGSLPAFNIQRELFAALAKLPIHKDALVASGIGKVVMFYIKSQKPEASIKRQAQKLVGEWTRPILKRSDDYRKREFQQAVYDPTAAPVRSSQMAPSQTAAMIARERKLATPNHSNRTRLDGGLASYTVVPMSNITAQGQLARVGAGGEDAFRKLKARQMGKSGGGSGRR